MKTVNRVMIALLVLVILGALTADVVCGCTQKDPQVVLPGWRDTRVEFGWSHTTIILLGEDGKLYSFWNTSPGWYEIPSPIENVIWCDL